MSKLLRFHQNLVEHPPAVIPLPKWGGSDNAPGEGDDEESSSLSVPSRDEIIDEARRECERIIALAHEEARGIREQAVSDGYSEGQLAAQREFLTLQEAVHAEHEEWKQERNQQQTAMELLAAQILAEREALLERALRPLPQFVMEVIRDLLHRELEMGPADLTGIVQEMLRYILDSTKVEVHVCPDDYTLATTAHPVWKSAKYGEWELVIIPDAKVERGGCELRSDVGRLDGTLPVKLEMLQATLDSVFGGGEPGYDHPSEPGVLG